jgi:Ser/Thr protein kinase RdoA (MazF antagonist)
MLTGPRRDDRGGSDAAMRPRQADCPPEIEGIVSTVPPRHLRDAEAWVSQSDSQPCIIKRYHPDFRNPAKTGHLDDLVWVHQLLADLAACRFLAPEPLPLFGGSSVVPHNGHLWDALSYRPGLVVGIHPRPSLREIGRFAGRFHQVAGKLPGRPQRTLAFAVRDLPALLDDISGTVTASAAALGEVQRAVGCLARELEQLPPVQAAPVHGDLTTHNVLSDPGRRRVVGMIDFLNAYIEDPLADIAFGLWRSGRRREERPELDPDRITAFARGYREEKGLPAHAAQAFPVYLCARGLQITVKALWRGKPIERVPAEISWAARHRRELEDAIRRA